MQNINKHLPDKAENFRPSTVSTQQQPNTSRDSNVNLEVRQTLAQLWLRMSEIYGAQFANQYGDVGGEAFQTWCLGLRDMNAKQIKHGFAKLLEREKTFVPNLNEFRKLCQVSAEELGLPDLETAYQEAARKSGSPSKQPWSHPAVYHAGRAAGWHELRGEPRSVTFPLFKAAYEDVCDRVLKGEELKLPDRFDRTKLEKHQNGEKKMTEESKAAGREALSSLKNVMGM